MARLFILISLAFFLLSFFLHRYWVRVDINTMRYLLLVLAISVSTAVARPLSYNDDLRSEPISERTRNPGGGYIKTETASDNSNLDFSSGSNSGGSSATKTPSGDGYYLMANGEQGSASDPGVSTTHPDGSVNTVYKDGRRTIKYKDGRVVYGDSKGKSRIEWPDGKVWTRNDDGSNTITYPEGQTETTYPDGRKTITDGTETTNQPSNMEKVGAAGAGFSIPFLNNVVPFINNIGGAAKTFCMLGGC